MKLVLLILVAFLLWMLVNFYFRYRTFRSLNEELEKVKWKNLPKKEYVRKCYDFVAGRFTRLNKCWLRYPWRNFYFGNVWDFKGESLPCLIQNKLFQRCLLERFNKKEIKTAMTKNFKKGAYIHFYSQVKVNGKWIDVDVWGKKWGIPFGKNIHNSKIRQW